MSYKDYRQAMEEEDDRLYRHGGWMNTAFISHNAQDRAEVIAAKQKAREENLQAASQGRTDSKGNLLQLSATAAIANDNLLLLKSAAMESSDVKHQRDHEERYGFQKAYHEVVHAPAVDGVSYAVGSGNKNDVLQKERYGKTVKSRDLEEMHRSDLT